MSAKSGHQEKRIMQTVSNRDTDPFSVQGCMQHPYPMLARLQRDNPVYWSAHLNGWVLTRYEDVAGSFRDRRFSSAGLEEQVRNQLRGHDPSIAKDFVRLRTQMMLHNDGKEHLRLRKPAHLPFSKGVVGDFEPLLRKSAKDLIGRIKSRSASFDFVTEFVEPYSTRVIAEIFGVPHSDRLQFQKWSDDVSRFFGESMGEDVAKDATVANDAILALEDYFNALLRVRRDEPGADLVSLLLRAVEEDKISDTELICQCILIMMAGHFSTIDQLANAMHTLLWHPAEMLSMARDPQLIPGAVEECMRFDGGVVFMARLLLEDVELGGKQLRAGDNVFLGMGAANRDPEVFEKPELFQIRRDTGRHLGFGFGPHQCIGASLARIEMRIALEELFKAWQEIELDARGVARRKTESLFFRGFYSLPVRGVVLS
jgi:cytochrome P450 PksS